MDSSQDTSVIRRLGRLVGRTVLTAAAIAISLYATRRQPELDESHETSAVEPTEETVGTVVEPTDEESRPEETPPEGDADETVEETAAEGSAEAPADDEPDESADEAITLEELTADELYPIAQQLGITGRATMDQAQLVQALQAEGIHDAADMEAIGEETAAEDEANESAASAEEPRALKDLTADELYPAAQHLNIAGRATMDQEQLVEALQAEGVHEVADGEPVVEEAPADNEAEEHADEARPLDELTATELYRVAQRLDIAGRSTMRKAQLVKALQAEGIDEAEV